MTDEADKYREIATSAIPEVQKVRIYDETWNHVLTDHGEPGHLLPYFEQAVNSAIAKPTSVHQSTTDPQKGFLFVTTEHTRNGKPMAVAVRVVEGTSARMTSAVFRTKSSGTARR